jgi:hypothetical protein
MRKASRSAIRPSSSYLATFAAAAGFGTLMAAEAYRRGAGRARQLTIFGDGAAWIWNLAAQHFPAATRIVDLHHAREHLHEFGRSSSSCSAPAKSAGSLSAWPTSTTATSPRSWPPPALSRWPAAKSATATRPCTPSKPTSNACTMPGTATTACSSDPAPSKPTANTSSARRGSDGPRRDVLAVPGALPQAHARVRRGPARRAASRRAASRRSGG